LSRERAYALVQEAAMRSWDSAEPFREALRGVAAREQVDLDEDRLDEVCSPQRYVARLDAVFDRLAALR
jgi:adenylosuccinate lyase